MIEEQDKEVIEAISIKNQALEKVDKLLNKIVHKLNMGDTFGKIANLPGALIYVADIDSHELVYMNDEMIKIFGDHNNKKCYKLLQNKESECSFCKNKEILEQESIPIKYIHYNENINQIVLCIDVFYTVNNNRLRFELAFMMNDLVEDFINKCNEFKLCPKTKN